MSRLAEYQTKAKELDTQINALLHTVDITQDGVETPEQIDQLKSWNQELSELVTSATKAREWDQERGAAKKHLDFLGEPINRFQYGGGGAEMEPYSPAAKSMAENFVSSSEWQGFLKSHAPDGRFPERMRINTNPVTFKSGVKALITGASQTSAGALFRHDRKPILDPGVTFRPLKIRDLVTVGQTDGDTVEYVRMGTRTNAAANVAEATATGGSSGAKPEGNMALSVITEPVKTVAEWVAITRRALADAGQLRTMVERLLTYDLGERLDAQMIAGDGVGENFTGILNLSGIQTQAYGTSIIATARKARTKVALTGRAMATGYVFHPTDLETLDLTMDLNGQFYFGGPIDGGVRRLWGVPVVESEAVTQGTALVGQWDLAYLWDREQTNILVSDSHSDFFTRNLLAVLAEMRCAFGILRPSAFVSFVLA